MSGRTQGYRSVRRAIDARQRVFDRQSKGLTPLRIARFRALQRMYATGLLVAAAAAEAGVTEPDGVTSWADEISQLERLRERNSHLWEAEPHTLSMGMPNGSPAAGDLVEQEQSAPGLGLPIGAGNGWVHISDIVIRDGDGDAGAVT